MGSGTKARSPTHSSQICSKTPLPSKATKEQRRPNVSKISEYFWESTVNISFSKALEQMPTYAKFMKQILSKKEVRSVNFAYIILWWTTLEAAKWENIFAFVKPATLQILHCSQPDLPKQPKPTTISCQMDTLMNKKETHLFNAND